MHYCPFSPKQAGPVAPQSHTAWDEAVPVPAQAAACDRPGGRVAGAGLGRFMSWLKFNSGGRSRPSKPAAPDKWPCPCRLPPTSPGAGPGPGARLSLTLLPRKAGRRPQRNHSTEFDLGWEQRAMSLVCTSAPNGTGHNWLWARTASAQASPCAQRQHCLQKSLPKPSSPHRQGRQPWAPHLFTQTCPALPCCPLSLAP